MALELTDPLLAAILAAELAQVGFMGRLQRRLSRVEGALGLGADS